MARHAVRLLHLPPHQTPPLTPWETLVRAKYHFHSTFSPSPSPRASTLWKSICRASSLVTPYITTTANGPLWTPSANGQYHPGRAYSSFWTPRPASDPVPHLFLHHSPILPRIHLFAWKLYHGALATSQLLFSRHINNSPSCPRCSVSSEDLQHALWDCPMSRALWQLGKSWFPTFSPWPSFTSFRSSLPSIRRQSQPVVLLGLFILWLAWLLRNDHLHDRRFSSPLHAWMTHHPVLLNLPSVSPHFSSPPPTHQVFLSYAPHSTNGSLVGILILTPTSQTPYAAITHIPHFHAVHLLRWGLTFRDRISPMTGHISFPSSCSSGPAISPYTWTLQHNLIDHWRGCFPTARFHYTSITCPMLTALLALHLSAPLPLPPTQYHTHFSSLVLHYVNLSNG